MNDLLIGASIAASLLFLALRLFVRGGRSTNPGSKGQANVPASRQQTGFEQNGFIGGAPGPCSEPWNPDLEHTRDELLRAQEIAGFGSWEADLSGDRLRLTESALKILGLTHAPRSSQDVMERIHPDDRDMIRQQRQKFLERGESYESSPFRMIRPDGEVRWLRTVGRILADDQGRPVGTCGVLHDITDQHLLYERVDQFRRLVEGVGDYCSVCDADYRYTWVNEPYAHAMGFSPAELEGRKLPELLGGEHFEDIVRPRVDLCLEGEPQQFELERDFPSIGRRTLLCRYYPLGGEDGTAPKAGAVMTDVTDVVEARGQLATIVEAMTDGMVAFDDRWRYKFVNQAAAEILGKSAEELLGTVLWEQFPGLVGSESESVLRHAMNEGTPGVVEEFYEPLGIYFETRIYPWENGVATFFRDVGERQKMIARLEDKENELRASRDKVREALETSRALIDALPSNIALLDQAGTVIDVNSRWQEWGQIRGQYHEHSGIGMNYLEVTDRAAQQGDKHAKESRSGLRAVLEGDLSNFQTDYPCHYGDDLAWKRLAVTPITRADGSPGGAVVMHTDVTERKLAELELERLAFRDPLTGLLSRNGFSRALNERLCEVDPESEQVVAIVDVVGLRKINNMHGYRIGDSLIEEFGNRLEDLLSQASIVGRISGAEFVLFFTAANPDRRDSILENLLAAARQPFHIGNNTLQIDVHIAYTLLANRELPVEHLIREAELALFESRENWLPEQRWVAYTTELDRKSEERHRLTEDLKNALENDEFELHFQPKVDLRTGQMVSAEALLRWNHPERGLQPPGQFIPVAEQSGLIGPIGNWALREACRRLQEWQEEELEVVSVSVNVSVVQFAMRDFPNRVEAALDEFGVRPDHLSLEITESVFENQSDGLLEQIRRLEELGVQLSLDDFGTGYSSLAYLQEYPFKQIKIDKAFTSRILDDPYSESIVKTVLDLASALNAETVAEGIENRDIRDALISLGCRFGQGFYFSFPLAAEDFQWLLRHRRPLPLA